MFGINGTELLVILVVALVLVGPERLPRYAAQLREGAVKVRAYVRRGQSAVSQEVGEDFDWNSLDPRRYDPRAIVKDAFFGESDAPVTTRQTGPARHRPSQPMESAPVDLDAT